MLLFVALLLLFFCSYLYFVVLDTHLTVQCYFLLFCYFCFCSYFYFVVLDTHLTLQCYFMLFCYFCFLFLFEFSLCLCPNEYYVGHRTVLSVHK